MTAADCDMRLAFLRDIDTRITLILFSVILDGLMHQKFFRLDLFGEIAVQSVIVFGS